MDQSELELQYHADDPPAAKAAAMIAKNAAASNRGRILKHLAGEEAHGATYREAAQALGLEPAEANRRCCDLHRDGQIMRLTLTRAPARGVPGHVYVLPVWVLNRPTE
jgi:hypothetical protein